MRFATLASLANGEASQNFSEEFERIVANIADGRFPASRKRKLELIASVLESALDGYWPDNVAYPAELADTATSFRVDLKKLAKEVAAAESEATSRAATPKRAAKTKGRKK